MPCAGGRPKPKHFKHVMHYALLTGEKAAGGGCSEACPQASHGSPGTLVEGPDYYNYSDEKGLSRLLGALSMKDWSTTTTPALASSSRYFCVFCAPTYLVVVQWVSPPCVSVLMVWFAEPFLGLLEPFGQVIAFCG